MTRSRRHSLASVVATALLWSAAATSARAQADLEDLRDELRQAASAARYPAFLSALIGLNSEAELSGANLRDESDPATEFSLFTFPWRRDLGQGWLGARWQIEGTLGYSTARTSARGLFADLDPQDSTDLDSRFEIFGATLGVGPQLALGEHFELRPSLEVGLAYVENDTRYGGPGGPALAALADGIVFNWQATYSLVGAGLALVREPWLWRGVAFEPLLRADVRVSSALDTDDRAQEGSEWTGWTVAQVRARGAVPWRVLDAPLEWSTHLAYKRFAAETAELLDFADYFELGLELTALELESLPLVSSLGLHGALIAGEDLSGWSLGVGASF